ncbi:MAG: hypothetical protein AB1700_10760, partial [Bacillota bacterium]
MQTAREPAAYYDRSLRAVRTGRLWRTGAQARGNSRVVRNASSERRETLCSSGCAEKTGGEGGERW